MAEVSGVKCIVCALHCDFRARSPECEVNCFAKPGKMWKDLEKMEKCGNEKWLEVTRGLFSGSRCAQHVVFIEMGTGSLSLFHRPTDGHPIGAKAVKVLEALMGLS